MDELFLQKFGVHPSLVCDMYQYNYKKPRMLKIVQNLFVVVYVNMFSPVSSLTSCFYKCWICFSGATPITPQLMTSNTQKAIQERRVFKCLNCHALCIAPLSSAWLRPGNNGLFYNLALRQYGSLEDKKVYTFPDYVSISLFFFLSFGCSVLSCLGSWCKLNFI